MRKWKAPRAAFLARSNTMGSTFIGCTLWTDFELFGDPEYAMKVAAETMNDYRKIRFRRYQLRLRPAHTLAKHRASRDFIAACQEMASGTLTPGAYMASLRASPEFAAFALDDPLPGFLDMPVVISRFLRRRLPAMMRRQARRSTPPAS